MTTIREQIQKIVEVRPKVTYEEALEQVRRHQEQYESTALISRRASENNGYSNY